jgi:mannose/fructose-specific phosphotransferase system component IIA
MSESYADDPPATSSAGFLIAVVGSLVAAILLILALVYYSGKSTRIAGLYTAVAAPANQALTGEVTAYNRDQRTNLAAAKKDLARLIKTDTTFEDGIVAVDFPSGSPSHSAARLVNADRALIKLFRKQEKSTTLRQLQSFDSQDQSANAVVAAQVQQTRLALGLPAATSGEF